MASDPSSEFASEITTLRDQLVDAVGSRRLGTLEQGLNVFVAIASKILERSSQLESLMPESQRVPPIDQGLRFDRSARLGLIADAVWPVFARAVQIGDSDPIYRVLSTTSQLSDLAWDHGDPIAYSQILQLVPRAVGLMGNMETQVQVSPSRLTQTLTDGWQVTVGSSRSVWPNRVVEFTELLLRGVLEVGKALVDSDNASELSAWSQVYGHAFFSLTLGSREPRPWATAVLNRKQAGYLALRAWVLLRWKEEWLDLEAERAVQLLASLERAGDASGRTWDAGLLMMRSSEGERIAHTLGWSWWESLAHDSGEAFMLGFDGYAADALTLEMLRSGQASMGIPSADQVAYMSEMDFEHADQLAFRLLASLKSIEKYGQLLEGLALEPDDLKQQLREIRDRAAQVKADRLGQELLDVDKVQLFETTAVEALNLRDELQSLLPPCNEPEQTDSMFGMSVLVAKDYFADSEVFADPASLGEQFGRQVLLGEGELTMARIGSEVEHRSVSLEELQGAVTEAVVNLRHLGDPEVIVSGDLRIWDALRRQQLGEQRYAARFDDPFEHDGVTYRLVSLETETVLVAVMGRLACFDRVPFLEEDEAFLFEDGRLLVSVEELSDDRVGEIAEARVADRGSLVAEEERALRTQVNVRVFVKPQVRILDPSAGLFLYVADGPVS